MAKIEIPNTPLNAERSQRKAISLVEMNATPLLIGRKQNPEYTSGEHLRSIHSEIHSSKCRFGQSETSKRWENSRSFNNDINRWSELHVEKLSYAYTRAGEETRRNEAQRKEVHYFGKTESELQIGNKVYIRNRGIKGRDKIQDKWKSDTYVIISKPGYSVYTVKLESDNGPVKSVNRSELKEVFI